MSWRPANDPGLGEPDRDALERIVVPRARDLGDFEVRRALPHRDRQAVGPFIFLDQLGPVRFAPQQALNVRPHPHIGLATVTYLFEGRILHRDSLGNAVEITPGALNLMTAGRGIVHSERTPQPKRSDEPMFGIQSWVALPAAHEEIAPSFQHFDASELPLVHDRGLSARVVAGSAFGVTSPVATLSEWLFAEVRLDAGAAAPFDPETEERAIHLVEGELEIRGDRFEASRLLVFTPGPGVTVRATRPSRMMFLGGAALEGPRQLWWNFVSSRRERIEQAKEDWREGRFAPVPGDTEWIPLPNG